jgi:hypothetical protein
MAAKAAPGSITESGSRLTAAGSGAGAAPLSAHVIKFRPPIIAISKLLLTIPFLKSSPPSTDRCPWWAKVAGMLMIKTVEIVTEETNLDCGKLLAKAARQFNVPKHVAPDAFVRPHP